MNEGGFHRLILEKPCCDTTAHDVDLANPKVALIGNPNVGKSTLFNVLTGARQHVGNWPGKTVAIGQGTWRTAVDGTADGGRDTEHVEITLVDLPGTYSLQPGSPDEELTRDVLIDRGMEGRPDVVVVTVDGSNLARNLYLLAQVMETGVPLVVALTMTDIAESRGISVQTERLSEVIGAPVVPVFPRRGKGVGALTEAVVAMLRRPGPPAVPGLGPDVEAAIGAVSERLPLEVVAVRPARWLAVSLLCGEPVPGVPGAVAAEARALGAALCDDGGRDTDAAGGREHVADADADAFAEEDGGGGERGEDGDDPETLIAERRYAWAHEVLALAVVRRRGARVTWSDRADRVLTSRWLGPPVFLLVMWAVFTLTTRIAAPLQGLLGDLFEGPVSDGAVRLLRASGLGGGPVVGLVRDGLISGVGQVLSFVPLMTIMFVLLAVLEDSGYLARAAFVVDRLMRLIGLPGRAFLPLIVGFGCNVPAIAGTRILADRRQRLLTGLLIPLVSCSARLTVFVLVAGVFFGSAAGTVVFAMYVLSVVLVILVGLLLRRTLFRDLADEPLVLDLPPYHLPAPKVIGLQSWQKLKAFLKTASGIIVATVCLVWLLASIPLGGHGTFGDTTIDHSVFGGAARAAAPVFAPAGFGDWHASAALITGFVAKEAVVSTVAQTYSMSEPADSRGPGELGASLRETFHRTSHGHPVPAVLAFMVFLLAYTPCMTTVAAQRAELGGRLTLFGIGLQLALAWLLAVGVFQIGRIMAGVS